MRRALSSSIPALAPWIPQVQQALRTSDSTMVQVVQASAAGLPRLVRALHADFPDLAVLGQVQKLADMEPGRVVVVQLGSRDGEWLRSEARSLVRRELRIVLWLGADIRAVLSRTAPEFLERSELVVSCSAEVPAFALNGLRKAERRAPGIVWEGGMLEPIMARAFPGQALTWVSAGRTYDDLVALFTDAHDSWLLVSDVDSEFRLRQVRWALAEAKRTGDASLSPRRPSRVLLVEPRVGSPGWWRVQGRILDLSNAIHRVDREGVPDPGRFVTLAGLEPDLVELLVDLLQSGIPVAELEALLLEDPEPAIPIARRALAEGLVESDSVVAGRLDPCLHRGLVDEPDLASKRRRFTREVGQRLRGGEQVSPDDLGVWISNPRVKVDASFLGLVHGASQQWIAEGLLRAGAQDHWPVLAGVANRLGDPLVAARWADFTLVEPASEPLERAAALHSRALAALSSGLPQEAEPLLREVVEIRKVALGVDHADTATATRVLGQALMQQGKYPQALKNLTRALEIERRVLGEDHADTAVTLQAMGQAMSRLGRHAEACKAFHQALLIKEKVHGPVHSSLAGSWHAIGQSLLRQGELQEALAAFRRDLDISEHALGSDHPSLATTWHAIGQVLVQAGEHQQAVGCFQRELAILTRALGADHAQLSDGLDAIGEALDRLGRWLEAIGAFGRSVSLKRAAYGPMDARVATTLHALAETMQRHGNIPGAIEQYRAALVIRQKALGPQLPTAVTEHALAQALVRSGLQEEAIEVFEQSLQIKTRLLGATHQETATTRFEWGRARRDVGDPGGIAEMRAATEILEQTLGVDHPLVKRARQAAC